MGIESGIWSSVSGLHAAQRQLEIAAHNIANVNTPGYSRQRADLTNSPPMVGVFGARGDGQMGTGVTIADVLRMRNGLTDAAYRGEAGNAAGAQARAEVLRRAETVLGPIDGGVPVALTAFWTSWDELSLNGTDTSARQAVLDAGTALSGTVRNAAAGIDRLVADTRFSIDDTVASINRLAKQAAELNQAIKDAIGANHSPNDLMDKRDGVVDQLAALTGGIVRQGDMGAVNVYVSNRPLVLNTDYSTMEANLTLPAGAKWTIDGDTVNTGGRLGALVDLVNNTLPSLRADLDAFATGLRDVINTAHQAGFDQDGAAGQAFFTGNDAGDLVVNTALGVRNVAASQSGAPGDGTNALDIAGLRTAAAVGPSTLMQAIHGLAGRLGSLSSGAQNASRTSQEILANITAERVEHSSVSTDEELADIVRFQHAYEASAKVIQILDSMMDTLLGLVR